MLLNLILLLTIVPAIELAILIKLGQHIGVGNTLLIIIGTGVAGAYLARQQGFQLLYRVQSNLNNGIMPAEEMLDGLMILIGGLLLLTPGLITDTLGFFLLIPFTRKLLKKIVHRQIQRMLEEGTTIEGFSHSPNKNHGQKPLHNQDKRKAEDADFY